MNFRLSSKMLQAALIIAFNFNHRSILAFKLHNSKFSKTAVSKSHFSKVKEQKVSRAYMNLFPDSALIPQFRDALITNVGLFSTAKVLGQSSLTSDGLIHAFFLGLGLWTFLGLKGWLVGVIYLILGSLVTKIKLKQKEREGIAEKRSGARGPENVWGSAATAMICASLTYIFPEWKDLLQLGFIASFATKLSDTVASEIGKAYGKTTYLVTTFQIVPRGTEGAVSVEGTLAGVIGSLVIAFVGYGLGLISLTGIPITLVAAFIATTFESYLGATVQSSVPWMTNEFVNLLNTIIGAIIGIGAGAIFK